jgi:hypothetical protein
MAVTLGNIGAGETLVGSPTATTVATKGIVTGDGIGISSSSTDITISSLITNVCICSCSTPQPLTNGSVGELNLDTTIYDPNNMRSGYFIQILSSGIYQISYFIEIDSNPACTGTYSSFLRDNALNAWATDSTIPNASAGATYLSGSFTVTASATDFYSILVSNSSGATITVQAGYPKVSVVQLGTS